MEEQFSTYKHKEKIDVLVYADAVLGHNFSRQKEGCVYVEIFLLELFSRFFPFSTLVIFGIYFLIFYRDRKIDIPEKEKTIQREKSSFILVFTPFMSFSMALSVGRISSLEAKFTNERVLCFLRNKNKISRKLFQRKRK